jgi:hypothetical protein
MLRATQVPFHKKGPVDDCNNYRGICLLSNVTKLLNKMILNRVRNALDRHLLPGQNAYREERSCQQHMTTAAELMHIASCCSNCPLVSLFVDFSKAFDSIDRRQLRTLMEHWCCPKQLLNVIFAVLDGQKLAVRYGGERDDASEFTPTAGVLQGDTLAPYLFLLPMDLIFRSLSLQHGAMISEITGNPGTKSRPGTRVVSRLHYLGYADDVILFSNTPEGAQALLHELEDTAALFGLLINTGKGKTEVLYSGAVTKGTILTKNGRVVPECTQYKYLGTLLGVPWKQDFSRRKQLAWTLLRRYARTWTASPCTTRSKLHLFHALVVPTLTYGVATYPWTQAVRDALNGTYNTMLRYALRDPIDWHHFSHTPIEELMGERLYLSAQVVYNRLREHGHWVRQHLRDDNMVPHPLIDVFAWETQAHANDRGATWLKRTRSGARRKGPRDGLLDMVRVPFYDELCRLASKKSRWRRVVEEETLREQLSVATATSLRRRQCEGRRWLESDHRSLMRLAKRNAEAVFNDADQ